MTEGYVVTIAVFLLTQVGTLIWVLATTKSDARVLRAQVSAVQDDVRELRKVLINLADLTGRINLIEDRMQTLTRQFEQCRECHRER